LSTTPLGGGKGKGGRAETFRLGILPGATARQEALAVIPITRPGALLTHIYTISGVLAAQSPHR